MESSAGSGDGGSGRDLDVVVLGATGVAGRHVAAYLAERAAEVGASWAAAGRDPAKIERVLGELGTGAPETIAADVDDPASLARMASRARVVLDLVGPYSLYGEPVIEACVANGAHYADLTGEMPFVRRMIDSHHAAAAAAGVKVVQVAGFEALPPDLAILLAAKAARRRWSEELAEVDVEVELHPPSWRLRPAELISGGTLQSGPAQIDASDAERMTDPAALVTDSDVAEAVRRRSPIALAPRLNSRRAPLAPMTPTAFINPAVVHRTAALLAARRGAKAEPFRYREGVVVPGGAAALPLRCAAAASMAACQVGFGALARARPSVRRRAAAAMRRMLPKSGFGPRGGSRDEAWRWRLGVDARTAGGHRLRVEVDADGHPAYLGTGRMLGEAGLMLAEDGATPEPGGCLTPATALGASGLDRFERAGLRFSTPA